MPRQQKGSEKQSHTFYHPTVGNSNKTHVKTQQEQKTKIKKDR